MFAELAAAIVKPLKREWKENSWIGPGTLAAINERGAKRNAGVLKGMPWRKLV